jgi:RNA polymerase primary sigma factor
MLTDPDQQSPEEIAASTIRIETLGKVLRTLSYRERRVLELRYGLDGQAPRTLDEIGRAFRVTRERIRQIETQSLRKLQALADAQTLRDVA